MEPSEIFLGMIAGAIGMGYFVYGKKQQKLIPLLSGIGLCIVPYFFESLAATLIVAVILAAAPFVYGP